MLFVAMPSSSSDYCTTARACSDVPFMTLINGWASSYSTEMATRTSNKIVALRPNETIARQACSKRQWGRRMKHLNPARPAGDE